MMWEILANMIGSFVGTIAYAVLFNVPRRFYLGCGVSGMTGWMLSKFVVEYTTLSSAVASFLGTMGVVLVSRMLTVRLKCPITVFMVSGIVSLVPGAGVYFTAYYLVTNQLTLAAQKGLESVKIAFGIVLGIVCIVSIPREFFQVGYWRQRRLFTRRLRKG